MEIKQDKSDDARSKALLAAHMEKARTLLDRFLDSHGVSLPVLGKAMAEFTETVFGLPDEAVCGPGCAFCCHLRVGVSIPELLVIFYELKAQSPDRDLAYFSARVKDILARGDTLAESFWLDTRTPCPFLGDRGHCLIYPIRPFSCRAYHSTDLTVCRTGFDEGRVIQVPCFPLYRACTDMYSSVFIRVMADRGFPSYQVGLVRGLDILFSDETVSGRWLKKEDVFAPARL